MERSEDRRKTKEEKRQTPPETEEDSLKQFVREVVMPIGEQVAHLVTTRMVRTGLDRLADRTKHPGLRKGLQRLARRQNLVSASISLTFTTLKAGYAYRRGELDRASFTETLSERFCATGGAYGGAAIGATLGSFIPGVGTGIGAIVGGMLGSTTGSEIGRSLNERYFAPSASSATPEEEKTTTSGSRPGPPGRP
ncbi:MAG: hypothetical protein D6795_07840 [Deltaproteobacteria bacterium]|nr:MAG: hypothetical protein D6795_07840 [Deltaproteobacteria bacterium]